MSRLALEQLAQASKGIRRSYHVRVHEHEQIASGLGGGAVAGHRGPRRTGDVDDPGIRRRGNRSAVHDRTISGHEDLGVWQRSSGGRQTLCEVLERSMERDDDGHLQAAQVYPEAHPIGRR